MVDRAKALESVQFGMESTPGTVVPAITNIRAMSVETLIPATAEFFRPDGHKFNALDFLNMEWSEANITGKPTYTELAYVFAGLFGNVAPVNVGTTGRKRSFVMADAAYATPATITVEKGGSVRAQRIAGLTLTDVGITASRKNGLALTAKGIGRLFTDGITMTASPTDVALIPIMGKQLDLFIDSSSASLGTTKMLRGFSVEHSITGAYGPIWAIDSSQTSFAGTVDLAPATSCKIMLEADAAGMAYLSQFRAGTEIFARLLATGPVIEAGTPPPTNTLQWDACLGIKTVTTDGDDDGVTVVTYDCEYIKDSTWGKAQQIDLTNAIATL